MSVVGVDFGNQNVLIAAAGRGGVDVILNGNSQRLNPCLVGFSDSRSMGEGAASNAMGNYRNTIACMKRLMGLAFNDPRAQAEMKWAPFTCVPMKHASGGPDSVGVQVSYKSEDIVLPIEMITGMMLKHMGSIAAAKAAESSNAPVPSNFSEPSNPLFPRDWVVAIPGYYTDSQRRAFVDAFRMVGIQGLQRLIHEHTATALAYGIFKDIRKEFTKDKPTNFMFIDIGASAYSVCIVAFEPGKLIVKTAQFDSDLGGRNFDLVIANWIADKFEEKYKNKLSGKPMNNPKVALKLFAAAEKAKKTLSPAGVREARIGLESLMDDLDFSCTLTDTEYESLCAPLLARLAPPIQRALAETNLKTKDLNCIEIVGGGSRVDCLKRTLATVLGLDQSATNYGLSTAMNSDESVARGAALQSAILSPRFKVLPYEIVEYQPYPIKVFWDGEASNEQGEGVEVEGQADRSTMPTNSVIMFGRGSNFPVTRRVTLRRSGEFSVNVGYDEPAIKLDFLQGQSADIASFKIKSPDRPANKVRVNIKEDINGCIVFTSAQMVEDVTEDQEMSDAESNEATCGEKKRKVKKTTLYFSESRSFDWSETEVNKIYEREVTMSNNDRIIKETAAMRNKLESYIYDMRDKIVSESHSAPYASTQERETMISSLETVENWLYEEGFDATKSVYSEKLKEVKKICDPMSGVNGQGIDRRRLSILLRNCASKIEQDEFDAKLVRDTLAQLDAYFKLCAKRPSPLLSSPSNNSNNNSSNSNNINNKHLNVSTLQQQQDFEQLARDFKPPSVSNTTSTSRARAPTPTAPPLKHPGSAAESSSSNVNTKIADKRCFQRPTNPNSTLICNGYVSLLLPKTAVTPTFTRHSQVLASLVKGRPGTNEETTLWVQRKSTEPNTSQAKLEIVVSVPLRWVVNIRPLFGTGEYGLAIQVYQPNNTAPLETAMRTTTATTTTTTKESIQEWMILMEDEGACADWIATLFSARNAAKEKARNGILKKSGIATADSTTSTGVPSPDGLKKQQSSQDTLPPHPHESQQKTIDKESYVTKLSIKELRAIAHGAGYDTRGMERADLEHIALMNAPASAFIPPPSVSSSSSSSTPFKSTSVPTSTSSTMPNPGPVPEINKQTSYVSQDTNHSNNDNENDDQRRKAAEIFLQKLEQEEKRKQTEEEIRRRKLREEEQRILADKIAAEAEERRKHREATQETDKKMNQNHSSFDPLNQDYDPFSSRPVPPSTTTSTATATTSTSIPPIPSRPTTTVETPKESSHHHHHQQQQQQPQQQTKEEKSSNINTKYAQAMMSDSSSTSTTTTATDEQQQAMMIHGLKRQILLTWALVPPLYQMLRPISDLLIHVHTVFPSCLGLPPHTHFTTWTPITQEDVMDGRTMKPDLEKIKKSVRKLRFLLHPDRLPRDLIPEQEFVCKMLWDVTNDSWEEYQKHEENLDWVSK